MLKIIGRAYDEKGDALLVENPKSNKAQPHITLSCAENVPPAYSEKLLAAAASNGTLGMFLEPFFIEVTEGYFSRSGEVVLSVE